MKKNIVLNYIFICLILGNCKGQNDYQPINASKTSKNEAQKKEFSEELGTINFLDPKYQKSGFSIPDNVNGNLYPLYSYYDKSLGSFSVNFIGENYDTQYFWNIDNKNGFFSKYSNPEKGAYDSKNIEKLISKQNYHMIAVFLPKQYIKTTDKQTDDFEIKTDAKTSIYLYENNIWTEIAKIETNKFPEKEFQYYIKLIQQHYYKNKKIPEKYQGQFSAYIETEMNTTGMANISYRFNISNNRIALTEGSYHEPINCEGNYFFHEENGILNLYYADEDISCISIEPKFKIKFDQGKYYIKGIGGEATSNSWVEMSKD